MFEFLSQPQGFQLPDPTALAIRGQTLANLAQQNQEGQMKLDALRQAQDVKTAAAKVFGDAQTMGWDAAIKKAAQEGNSLGAAAALQLRRQDEGDAAKIENDRAQANERNAGAAEKAFQIKQKGLSDIANAADGMARSGKVDMQYLNGMAKFYGIQLPPMQEGTDPAAYLSNLAATAISAKDRMQNDTTLRGQDVTMRGQDMTAQTAAGEQAVQRRGQDITAGTAAARLKFDREQAANPNYQHATDAAGNPVAFNTRTGQFSTATDANGNPLPTQGKPLTESQGNATNFGMRLQAANNIFSALEDSGFDPGSLPNTILPANRVGNYIADPKAQQAYQAKLNFMTANLRKESGASINQSEFETEDKKYFPQPGDSPQVRAQKRQMRALAIEGMSVQAGPGSKNIGDVKAAPGVAQPKLGEVRKGYMYKGGDPSSPSSWEKAS